MGEYNQQKNPQSTQSQPASTLVSKNVTVDGHRTSIRLEPEMWLALKEIAYRERCTIHDLCTLVSLTKDGDSSLTASIRVFLMLYYRAATTEIGHRNAGHGNFDAMLARARRSANELEGTKQQDDEFGDEQAEQKSGAEIVYKDFIPPLKKTDTGSVKEVQALFGFKDFMHDLSERSARTSS